MVFECAGEVRNLLLLFCLHPRVTAWALCLCKSTTFTTLAARKHETTFAPVLHHFSSLHSTHRVCLGRESVSEMPPALPHHHNCIATALGGPRQHPGGRALMAPGTRAHLGTPSRSTIKRGQCVLKTFPSPPHTELQYPQHVLAHKPIEQIFTVMDTGEKRNRGTFCEG